MENNSKLPIKRNKSEIEIRDSKFDNQEDFAANDNNLNNHKSGKYKPENLSSLAAKFQVSNNTLKAWIKSMDYEITIEHKKVFTPKELSIIYDHLGEVN